MTEEENPEEKQERKTLSIEDLLHIAHGIENVLIEDHDLSSAEMMYVASILQAEATTNYMMGKLIRGAQVIQINPEQATFNPTKDAFKQGDN